MKRSLLQVSLLVLLILTNGLAQTDRGTIRGTVEDTSGAAVAGAEFQPPISKQAYRQRPSQPSPGIIICRRCRPAITTSLPKSRGSRSWFVPPFASMWRE